MEINNLINDKLNEYISQNYYSFENLIGKLLEDKFQYIIYNVLKRENTSIINKINNCKLFDEKIKNMEDMVTICYDKIENEHKIKMKFLENKFNELKNKISKLYKNTEDEYVKKLKELSELKSINKLKRDYSDYFNQNNDYLFLDELINTNEKYMIEVTFLKEKIKKIEKNNEELLISQNLIKTENINLKSEIEKNNLIIKSIENEFETNKNKIFPNINDNVKSNIIDNNKNDEYIKTLKSTIEKNNKDIDSLVKHNIELRDILSSEKKWYINTTLSFSRKSKRAKKRIGKLKKRMLRIETKMKKICEYDSKINEITYDSEDEREKERQRILEIIRRPIKSSSNNKIENPCDRFLK